MTDEQPDLERCDQKCQQGSQCIKVLGHVTASDQVHRGEDGCTFYDQKPVKIANSKYAATFRYCEHCDGAIPPFALKCPCHPNNRDQPVVQSSTAKDGDV